MSPLDALCLLSARLQLTLSSLKQFSYSALEVSQAAISVTVTNAGPVPGREVAQLYLGYPASAGEPPRQLKGFVKTPTLGKGQSTTVTFDLDDRSFSIWNVTKHSWQLLKGTFGVHVGSSSRDIRVTSHIVVR